MPCITYIWTIFIRITFSKSLIFKVKNIFIQIPKNLWQSKILCFPCDLSNIQKYSFEECSFTWVAPLIVILPTCYATCTNNQFTIQEVAIPTYVKDTLMLIAEYLKRPLKLMVKLCRLTLSTCLVSLLKIITFNGVKFLFKIIQITHLKNWNKHFKWFKIVKNDKEVYMLCMWRSIMNTYWN
jgi:hypothetical protein